MDIKDAENKVEQIDSLLTKVWNLFKKHWWHLLILGAFYGLYKFCMLVGTEIEIPDRSVYVNDSTINQLRKDSVNYYKDSIQLFNIKNHNK